jgi:hypothetical protein
LSESFLTLIAAGDFDGWRAIRLVGFIVEPTGGID